MPRRAASRAELAAVVRHSLTRQQYDLALRGDKASQRFPQSGRRFAAGETPKLLNYRLFCQNLWCGLGWSRHGALLGARWGREPDWIAMISLGIMRLQICH